MIDDEKLENRNFRRILLSNSYVFIFIHFHLLSITIVVSLNDKGIHKSYYPDDVVIFIPDVKAEIEELIEGFDNYYYFYKIKNSKTAN